MDEEIPDLGHNLGVLWRRRLLIVGAIVATTGGAVFYSARQPKSYEAASRLIVRPVVPAAAFSSLSSSSTGGPLGLDVGTDTQKEIVASGPVAGRVRAALKLDRSPSLLGSISVRLVTDELLEIRATARDPVLAARLAESYGEQYLAYRRDSVIQAVGALSDDLSARAASLQGKVNTLDARIVVSSARAAAVATQRTPEAAARVAELQAEIEQVKAQRDALISQLGALRARLDDLRGWPASAVGGGEIVQQAVPPLKPSAPKPLRDGVVGALLGAILGLGLAFLRERLDERVQTIQDAERASRVQVLGAIYKSLGWRRAREPYLVMGCEPRSRAAESYRALRQSLAGLGLGSHIKTILVTSASPGEGKTSTAANLAIACAQSGMRVVAISGDLRRPRLHAFFCLENKEGLASALGTGEWAPLSLQSLGFPNVSVVPSGSVPDDPAKLLDSPDLKSILAQAGKDADVVLIDSPPLSAGADALVLGAHADLVLVAIRQDVASGGQVARGVEAILRAGNTPTVAVLTVATEAAARGRYPYANSHVITQHSVGSNGHESRESQWAALGRPATAGGNSHQDSESEREDQPQRDA